MSSAPTDARAALHGAPVLTQEPPRHAFRRTARDMVARLSSSAIALEWLVRLRWHAAAGQALTVAVVTRGFGLQLPVVPLLALVATTAVSNLLLALWLRRAPAVRPALLGGVRTGRPALRLHAGR